LYARAGAEAAGVGIKHLHLGESPSPGGCTCRERQIDREPQGGGSLAARAGQRPRRLHRLGCAEHDRFRHDFDAPDVPRRARARYFFEAGVRIRIQKRFSTYVDPALVNYLLEHPEKIRLDGELREMTVVFTDLVGFTSLAEEMREAAVKLLGEYMQLMVPLIR